MSEIPIPKCVTDTLLRLNELTEKYPNDIPVSAAASFLGMDARSLKSYLMEPWSCGMGWRRDGAANRAFLIPTTKFYLWYRNFIGKGV